MNIHYMWVDLKAHDLLGGPLKLYSEFRADKESGSTRRQRLHDTHII